MARVSVDTTIDAAPEVVWAAVEDISSHVEWMAEAVAIRFTGPSTAGVGTTFECDTKVGPLRLTDEMEITRWDPGRAMGIRHVGAVTGEGVFLLSPDGRGCTTFRWEEELAFPWWMGGPVGAVVGGWVLGLVWRRNLRRLRARVEAGAHGGAT